MDTLLDVMQKLFEYMQVAFEFVDSHQTGVIMALIFYVVLSNFRRRR